MLGVSMKLIVKNLNQKIVGDDLRKLFTPLGKVISVAIMYDEATGLSTGEGWVEMANSDDGLRAIIELNETTFGTRLIYVNKFSKR